MIHNAGSLNIDDVFHTSHIVRPGETISARTLKRFAGGKGLNQSIALARAASSVRHVGRIGADGLFLQDLLAAERVDVSGIEVGDEPTGHAIIQVADDGENAIVLYGGANQTWTAADIQRLLDVAGPGDVLMLQNEINMMEELMKAASDARLKLAMNPAPMLPELRHYPIDRLSWLVVNEIEGRELACMAQDEYSDTADEAVLYELQRLCPDTVIVMTLGKKGAIRLDNQGMIRERFPDPGPIVDTTGAGDTFMGYFLAAEIAGMERCSGLRRACAAGALAVTRFGAAASIPRLEEVEKIITMEQRIVN